MTLFTKIEDEFKAAEAKLGTDLSELLASIKAHFEAHAAGPAPGTASPSNPQEAVAQVLSTAPAAPTTVTAEPPKAA